MIDVGGTSIKLRVSGSAETRKFPSGPDLTAGQMVQGAVRLAAGWQYDVVSIGFPGRVFDGRPAREPENLGDGWVDFDYESALERPVRIVNDAVLQALAGYEGGRMLFIGLGTGVGSVLCTDDVLVPLELGGLRLRRRCTLRAALSKDGRRKYGLKRWRASLGEALGMLQDAFWPDEILLGGGSAKKANGLPANCRVCDNEYALRGAMRLWGLDPAMKTQARGTLLHILAADGEGALPGRFAPESAGAAQRAPH
jgi:polyphosphate glucokinase